MEIQIETIPPKAPEGDKLVVRRNSDPSPQTQEQKNLDFKVIYMKCAIYYFAVLFCTSINLKST